MITRIIVTLGAIPLLGLLGYLVAASFLWPEFDDLRLPRPGTLQTALPSATKLAEDFPDRRFTYEYLRLVVLKRPVEDGRPVLTQHDRALCASVDIQSCRLGGAGYDCELVVGQTYHADRTTTLSVVYSPTGNEPPGREPSADKPDTDRFTPLANGWFIRIRKR